MVMKNPKEVMKNPKDDIFIQTGDTPSFKSIYAIALYSPTSGKIRHMYHVNILDGADPINQKMIQKEAIDDARKLGHQIQTLEILHIPDLRDSLGSYRVDVKKKVLINTNEPEQKRNKSKK